MKLGDVTHTDITIMYIRGIADEETIQAFKDKLLEIKVDMVLESGYIEQIVEDNKYSPFPTMFNTERPDSVAANLLDGRIAIFVDGTPFVLIAPTTFFMFFHTVEDYYQRYDISSLIRMLRFVCLIISLYGPAIFVAALNFHQEMIPTPLLINLASQREGVPFPAFVEAVLMEVTFEIIREAGVRMPSPIGQTVSIIGGLVLGTAAVQAGIVSPAMVIVVSLTGISSFATPAFNMALSIRMLRFIIMGIAAFMGLYGIAIFTIMLIAHLCSLRSLGVPYMTPIGPFVPGNLKDTFIRSPQSFTRLRKRLVNNSKRSSASPAGKGPPGGNLMNGKGLLRLIAVAVLVLPLGGCWNSRELNELAVVSGIGMDLVPETDEYRVTFQLVNPSSTSTSTSPGSGKPAVVVVSATDKTMFGALRRASKHVTRQLFLPIPS